MALVANDHDDDGDHDVDPPTARKSVSRVRKKMSSKRHNDYYELLHWHANNGEILIVILISGLLGNIH